jgi:predicted lipoprotein with Yx(FWY)xxD motif
VFRSPQRQILSAGVLVAALLGAAACANEPATPADPPPASAAPEGHGGHGGHGAHGADGAPAPALFAVQTGPLGVVATDGSGRLLYRSDADRTDPPTSNCAGPCAETWIPVVADPGQELELAGVKQDVVGRFQRPDGTTQLTLAGWPLYRYRDDDGSLETAGQNGADGSWFVVTPTGEKATAS